MSKKGNILSKKGDIFAAGYDLFSKNGFKSVSVSDITNLAGISVGSFYNYYASKEALFIEIYAAENRKAKDYIMGALDQNKLPADVVQQFMLLNMETMKKSNILPEWYGDSIGEGLRNYFQNESETTVSTLHELIKKMLEGWRKENILREDISNEEILSMYDALVYLDIYTNKTTSKNFSKTIEWLAKFAAKGIMKNKECD